MKSYFNSNISVFNKGNSPLNFKKIGLPLVMLCVLSLSTMVATAQEASSTINIILADVLSIDPESAAMDGSVDFSYQTAADYNSEQVATVPKSLVITFSKDFDVRVKANGEYFESGNNFIPVNVITIRKNASSTLTGTSSPVVLSTTDQILVSGAALGYKLQLDLDYLIPASKASSNDILGKPAGNYTQKVIYTATAL